MKNTSNIIAIYSRKSKFTGKGESIGNQVELCREYIRTHYGDEAAEQAVVFEDEGFSGGNVNRPAFKKMMVHIERGEFKALVVYRLDRVSRNVGDFSSLIEDLNRRDIVFVSIREQFDTATPMGRAMMYIASVFAQLERETIAERIRDNMHELAKTGRWLGGNTPTGYCSESVKSVTVDGKTKKACKLKLIPEEAETVKIIFDLFVKTGSLTLTEAELIQRRIMSKNGNHFTRFSMKAILQNPVYMIADEAAYEFFKIKDADLFSAKEEFDGVHGMLAYNRTDQEKGKATVYNPVSDWIVSVGKHHGIIPGRIWVDVQDHLEQNKSKSFRRPRRNEALLTGLLFCSCGNRMYPKLSKRKTADGDIVYTYVCKMKERSKKNLCDRRNASGNILDLAVMGKIKQLADEKSDVVKQLEKSRIFYTGNRGQYEQKISVMKKEKADLEKKVSSLIDTLAELNDNSAKKSIVSRINEMNTQTDKISRDIDQMIRLTAEHALGDIEFDSLRQMLSVCKNTIDDMSCEQKRAAMQSLVRRVVWDGENAHVVLFGSSDGDIERLAITPYVKQNETDTDDGGDFRLQTKTDWGEDSK